MPKPFTRAQARRNAAFLRRLAVHGNARRAAAELGYNRATFTRRRAQNSRFATLGDAALAAAHAKILPGTIAGLDCPRQSKSDPGDRTTPQWGTRRSMVEGAASPAEAPSNPRARGGEPILVRLPDGRVQLRRAPKGRMTKAAEQAFLAALSATCNVRLSAAAAGFTHSAFYQRAKKDPGFAREWRLAEERGWQALDGALLAGFLPDSHEDDAWRHNAPPEMPAMTVSQAIQLAVLHEKSACRQIPARRGARDESLWDAYRRALTEQTLEARLRREEDEAIRTGRAEPDWREEDGEGIAALPALEQVTGWSGADPAKKVHDPDKAMFGGWRITDWKDRER